MDIRKMMNLIIEGKKSAKNGFPVDHKRTKIDDPTNPEEISEFLRSGNNFEKVAGHPFRMDDEVRENGFSADDVRKIEKWLKKVGKMPEGDKYIKDWSDFREFFWEDFYYRADPDN